MEKIVPISDLQAHAKRLVEQVKKTGEPIVITQRGRAAAMLVNYELYEGHMATLDEIAFHSPQIASQIISKIQYLYEYL